MDIIRFIMGKHNMGTNDEESLLMEDVRKNGQTSNRKSSKGISRKSKSNSSSKDDSTSSQSDNLSVTQALWKSYEILQDVYEKLFSNTTCLDKLILLFGIFFAFIHGITFPFVAVIFGSLTNSYIQQAVHGYAIQSSNNSFFSTAGLYNFSKDLLNLADIEESTAVLPNSTSLGLSADIGDTFDLINHVIQQTFTEAQVFTKFEFVHYVHITGILFCSLAFIMFICSFFQALCWELVSLNQIYRLRKSVIEKLLCQDLDWFWKHSTTELVSNIFNDVNDVRNGIGFKFSHVVEYASMFAAAAIISVLTNWHLAAVFLLPVPFIFFKILTLGKKIAEMSAEEDAEWKKIEDVSNEVLTNYDTVVAFGEQKNEIQRYSKACETYVKTTCENYQLAAFGNALLVAVIYISYALAFWYGCKLLFKQTITPGEIYTIFLSITMGSLALSFILSAIPTIFNGFASAKHLQSYNEPEPKINYNLRGEEDGHQFIGSVEFKNVNFEYDQDNQVLNNLSFQIEAGKTVAVVGKVGAGKTTIANLLLRLYDPTNDNGEIKIDDINIKNFSIGTLRRNIGTAIQVLYVSEGQEVDDCIRSGRSFITEQALTEVKRVVGPIKAYEELEEELKHIGFYTQDHLLRQVDLARALVTQPSILILDEAFADLSPENRLEIRQRVLEFRKGKTTIILTNRFSTVQDVERIYVLKDGQIHEKRIGTHSELMERQEYYASMVESEIRFEKYKAALITGETDSLLFMPGGSKGGVRKVLPTIWDLIFSLLNPETKAIWIGGFIGCLIMGADLVILSFYFVEIFGTFSKTGPELEDDGIFWAALLSLLAVIAALGIWLRNLFSSTAGIYLLLGLIEKTFTSVLRRPKSYYNDHKTTPIALGSRIIRNSSFIKNIMEYQIPRGLSTVLCLALVLVIVCALVWQVGLIAICIISPILIGLTIIQYKYVKKRRNTMSNVNGEASQVICRAIDTIELTHIFCMQKNYIDEYCRKVQSESTAERKQAILFSLTYAACESLFFLFCGSAFLYGAYLISIDLVEPQSLFKVFFAVSFCQLLFSQCITFTPDIADAVVALEQANNLLLQESAYNSTLDALNNEGQIIEFLDGRIEFERVSFGYETRRDILKDFTLSVPANSTIGLTGPPGFGGSTILFLVQRFFDTRTGKLCFDGTEYQNSITRANIGQVRQNLGWVQQKISFFDGCLADNLKYGCKEKDLITADELKNLLITTKLIEEYGDKLDEYQDKTYWNTLSKGKKVLIAIARAILRKPKILLLDSPTNSMSPAEEEVILEVIKEVKKDRTCILVSNSPSTLAALTDFIAVVQGGIVTQQGTHAELLEKDGHYSTWVELLKKVA